MPESEILFLKGLHPGLTIKSDLDHEEIVVEGFNGFLNGDISNVDG